MILVLSEKNYHCTAENHDFFFWYILFILAMEIDLQQVLGIWNCDSFVRSSRHMLSTYVK